MGGACGCGVRPARPVRAAVAAGAPVGGGVPDRQCGDVVADGRRGGQGGEQVGGVVVGQGAAVFGALQEIGAELFGACGERVGVGAAQSGGVGGGVGELPVGQRVSGVGGVDGAGNVLAAGQYDAADHRGGGRDGAAAAHRDHRLIGVVVAADRAGRDVQDVPAPQWQ
jgi:hypothetical protein